MRCVNYVSKTWIGETDAVEYLNIDSPYYGLKTEYVSDNTLFQTNADEWNAMRILLKSTTQNQLHVLLPMQYHH